MISETKAISLLKKHSPNERSYLKVLKHSLKVKSIALEIANKIKNKNPNIKINFNLISVGSLLHDIGRFKYHSKNNTILHGLEGYHILKKEGLNKIALIAKNHMGYGIYRYDIKLQRLPLPIDDYAPKTLEQKIICYADNLTFNTKRKTIYDVLRRFFNEISFLMLKRGIILHNELATLMSDKKININIELLKLLFNKKVFIMRFNKNKCIDILLSKSLQTLVILFKEKNKGLNNTNASKIIIEFRRSKINKIDIKKENKKEISSSNFDLILNYKNIIEILDKGEYFLRNWKEFYEYLLKHNHSKKFEEVINPFFKYDCLFI